MIFFLLVSLAVVQTVIGSYHDLSSTDLLSLGDQALASSELDSAADLYQQGIELLTSDESLATAISLHTNLGTTFSTMGRDQDAIDSYRNAIVIFSDEIDDIVDEGSRKDAEKIAAQASFFLGMVYQELGQHQKSADAYAYANTLDPQHWAALANMASILHDELKQHDDALLAYNKAFQILTQTELEPTDPPENPRYILSQLQYRMGLAITSDPNRKCALVDDPTNPVSCQEMAANAFSTALQYDPNNENAKHMLATITADATMKRASNVYVKDLFDDYAHNFEHSLVSELGYTGFERLRRGFDRAFGGEAIPQFPLVVDAGCGTGLVGEQFRNVSVRLIGVDLSQAIIDEAKKARPDLYDDTREGDVMEVFREMKPISLIVAGDSYIYFGDLDPLFESMQYGLEAGGYVAFTLENVSEESEQSLQESKPDWRWQLTASGRFAHRKEYVLSVGEAHDFELFHYEPLVDFRFENGVGVRGHIFVMKRGVEEPPEL